LKTRVHKLCGSAGAIGIYDLATAARELEQAIAKGEALDRPKRHLTALMDRTLTCLAALA